MNNRFIKMFWHSDKPAHVKNRLGGPHHHGKQFKPNDSHNEELDPEKAKELKAKEMLAIKKNQELLQVKNELLKKAEEKKKAVMAQQGGILKSKRVRVASFHYFLSSIECFTGFVGRIN